MEKIKKFRAWNKGSSNYVSPCNIRIDGNGTIIWQFGYEESICDNNDYIIEFYTGLKDKNGKEIYEGDIIRIGKTCSFVVYWDTSAGFRFNSYMEEGLIDDLYNASKIGEVIGNMQENKELLTDRESDVNGV